MAKKKFVLRIDEDLYAAVENRVIPIVPQPGEDGNGKRWQVWVGIGLALAGIIAALVFTLR